MTKRLFTIVIHLYKMPYEPYKIMESDFIFILQMSLLSFFFFLQKSFYWGVKSPKNDYETRIEAICHCYGINLPSLYSVKGKVVP
jgi:hypothetical protein